MTTSSSAPDARPEAACLLVGDSICAGYAPHVVRHVPAGIHVDGPTTNVGHSRNVLAILADLEPEKRWAVIHFNCGLHDIARYPGKDTAVPVPEYADNLTRIVAILRGRAHTLIWARTTPVIDGRSKKNFVRLSADVDRYNQVADAVMGRLGIPVNDLNRIMVEAGTATCLSEDLVHLRPAGYELLGQAVAQHLATAVRA